MFNQQPTIAVIFPLYDDRGMALRALAAWQQQRTDQTPFTMVVVDAGRRSLAEQVARQLGPGDRMVRADTRNEATLYNAGAQSAQADWLVFTESHVVPTAGAMAALTARAANTTADAAVLNSVHGTRSRFSEVDAALGERESSQMRALGLWRCVGLRGFAVRRRVFDALGGFQEDYYRFAETALAIRLVDRGYRLEEYVDVVVEHIDSDSIGEIASAMALGRLGACRFHAAEPQLAQAYFGCAAAAHPPGCSDPVQARRLWSQALTMFTQGKLLAAWRLARLAQPDLGAALLGWKAAELSTRGRVIAAHLRLLTMLYGTHAWRAVADCPAVLDQYVRLRECCADVGAVQFQREQDPPAGVEDSLAASEITADSLIDCGVHFFSPEVWQGEAYCWSAPRAAVRLLLPPGEVVIRLDARPTGRWLSRRPKLYLDGVRIPAQQVSEESGIVQVRVGHAQSRGGDVLLSWSCRPFVPARSGLADRRKLGVALIGVRAERQSQLARIPARERAA